MSQRGKMSLFRYENQGYLLPHVNNCKKLETQYLIVHICSVYSLSRFENYGIYVVMFWEILRTLIRIAVVFFFLILAFGLSFFVLLGSQVGGMSQLIFYLYKFYF